MYLYSNDCSSLFLGSLYYYNTAIRISLTNMDVSPSKDILQREGSGKFLEGRKGE